MAKPSTGRASLRHARRPDPDELRAAERAVLAPLDNPARIQAFLDAMPVNHELGGETLLSVREVLRLRRAHCIEAAFVAAYALWMHGEPPLAWHLDCDPCDYPHVVALFRRDGCWGAISKSNHAALRFRDPVYRTLRELAMSYFHEYCDARGDKTLRSYSAAFDLRRLPTSAWVSTPLPCHAAHDALANARHFRLVTAAQARRLVRRDAFERRAARLVQHPRPRR
jgi:hypothetical protein